MEITGLDIGAVATAVGAVVKALHSDSKVNSAKKGIDERFAVLEERMKHCDKRLDDGDNNFKSLDGKIDRMNESLNQLIGEIRAGHK